MTDLSKVFERDNLRRAYRWTMSNPDGPYKAHFRDSYVAFAIAADTQLRWIRTQGRKDRYEASDASKVMVPKPSGTLRPITLLKVEDQIVYQAIVNLITEKLQRRTRQRYHKSVFAHLYSGKNSPFFNMKWKTSYKKFAERLRDSYLQRYDHIANFDLTSFYDSIDHNVLEFFLNELKIDKDTIAYLKSCLQKWTATTSSNGPAKIYHGHGIPQGPLASTMLSETVLLHLDKAGEQDKQSTVYLRYVDDIKILAKTKKDLQAALITLDIASKEVGLFPQTSKISIHKITNPENEIKSISRPPEPSLVPAVNQKKLVSRILQICSREGIAPSESTRFKYLLAKATPTYKLNARLIKVLRSQPEYAAPIAFYISRYRKVPSVMASDIADYIGDQELYQSVSAVILDASLGRLPKPFANRIGQIAAKRLLSPRKKTLPLQSTYKASLIDWALSTNQLKFIEYEQIVLTEDDWWIKKRSIKELNPDIYGIASYEKLLNMCMREGEPEVARICVTKLIEDNKKGSCKLTTPYGDIETTAKHILKEAKLIPSVGVPKSHIPKNISYILGRRLSSFDWKSLFGTDHTHAERVMIWIKGDYDTNIEQFLLRLDSWCDLLCSNLYRRIKLGNVYPKYGAALKDPHLAKALPVAISALGALHALRLESSVAHPTHGRTRKPTRQLKHRDFFMIRPNLCLAFDEIEHNITP